MVIDELFLLWTSGLSKGLAAQGDVMQQAGLKTAVVAVQGVGTCKSSREKHAARPQLEHHVIELAVGAGHLRAGALLGGND